MGCRQETIKTVDLAGNSVEELIEVLQSMPKDAKVTTADDNIIEKVTLIWDMGDWILLTISED